MYYCVLYVHITATALLHVEYIYAHACSSIHVLNCVYAV